MKDILKPKIGLVGIMSSPWKGDKENYFSQDKLTLESVANQLDFELRTIPEGVYNIEAAQSAAQALSNWGADFVLVQLSSFASSDLIRPFAAMDVRLGLWSVPERLPSREGGLPLNSFTCLNLYNSLFKTYFQYNNKPVKWFFGLPEDDLFRTRFEITVAAIRALINLRGARIGLIGGVAPGFHNLIIDPRDFESRFGIRVDSLELDSVLSRARNIKDEVILLRTAINFKQPNVRMPFPRQEDLQKLARLQIAFESIVAEHDFDALAISCWPRFQDEPGVAVCSLMGQLNGLGLVSACEGDVPSAVTMLALHYITNGDIVTLMDLVTLDPIDETALLWHCGPTAPQLADENGVNMGPLWLFEGENNRQIGLHNDMTLKPGDVTIFGITPDTRKALILSGTLDNQKPAYKGSRAWLGNIKINDQPVSLGDMAQTLMSSGYQHHYPLAYGRLEQACLELTAWLGITPIKEQKYTPYLKRYNE